MEKMKEDKGSAPGIHFGYMKCIGHESHAAEVVSLMALLPLTTGYAPLQWKKGINSMIPKKLFDLCPKYCVSFYSWMRVSIITINLMEK